MARSYEHEYEQDDTRGIREGRGGTTAFLAGLLVGAGAALLLAPQSGNQTRRQLREYTDKAKEIIESAVARFTGGEESEESSKQSTRQTGNKTYDTAKDSEKGSASKKH